MVCHYFVVVKQRVKVADLYSVAPESLYRYWGGFNLRAYIACTSTSLTSTSGTHSLAAYVRGRDWRHKQLAFLNCLTRPRQSPQPADSRFTSLQTSVVSQSTSSASLEPSDATFLSLHSAVRPFSVPGPQNGLADPPVLEPVYTLSFFTGFGVAFVIYYLACLIYPLRIPTDEELEEVPAALVNAGVKPHEASLYGTEAEGEKAEYKEEPHMAKGGVELV